MRNARTLQWSTGLLLVVAAMNGCQRFAPLSPGDDGASTSLSQLGPEPVLMPVEVLGFEGTSKTVRFELPEALLSGGPISMSLRLADMDSDDKGYIEINGTQVARLKNSEVQFLEPYRKAFGGFGGGYSVFRIEIPVPPGVLAQKNVLKFGFDKFDGFSLGYRVLEFNFLQEGRSLLPARMFQERPLDDVDGEGKVANSMDDLPENIDAGKNLWMSAPLLRSYRNPAPMKATCAACHFTDGYDLKYFGFSRFSIIQRARFHGLSEKEGQQIAAYIRSINVSSYGRPWNPPYQPGPGLAEKPPLQWFAGAGIDAVVDDENLSIQDAFPQGVPEAIPLASKGRLDLTNVRIALELPVWKHWLPRAHPTEDDFFGDEMKETGPYRFVVDYVDRRAPNIRYKNAQDYSNFVGTFGNLMGSKWYDHIVSPTGLMSTKWPLGAPGDSAYKNNVDHQIRAYSLIQWRLVKNTQAMHQYGFDQIGDVIANGHLDASGRTPRALLTKDLFDAAPHMVKLTMDGNNGVRSGAPLNWGYFSEAWYYSQLLANDNFRLGDGATHWPYTTAFAGLRSGDFDFPAVRLLTILKAIEAHTFLPIDSNRDGRFRFFPYLNRLNEGLRGRIVRISAENKSKLTTAIIAGYLQVQNQYSLQQLQTHNPDQFSGLCATTIGVHSDAHEGCAPSVFYNMYRPLAGLGVQKSVLEDFGRKAEAIWPQFAWSCVMDLARPYDQCKQENRSRGIQAD